MHSLILRLSTQLVLFAEVKHVMAVMYLKCKVDVRQQEMKKISSFQLNV